MHILKRIGKHLSHCHKYIIQKYLEIIVQQTNNNNLSLYEVGKHDCCNSL